MLSDYEAFANIHLALKKYRHKPSSRLYQFVPVPCDVDVQVDMYNMRTADEKQYSGAFCPSCPERVQMILVRLLSAALRLLKFPERKTTKRKGSLAETWREQRAHRVWKEWKPTIGSRMSWLDTRLMYVPIYTNKF